MSLARLALAALALACWLAPADATAAVTPFGALHLIDRGEGPAPANALHLLDVRLDEGGGGGAGNGGVVPAIVSFLIPGLGQILWQNQIVKGVVMILVAIVINGATFGVSNGLGILSLAYHILASYDAYVGGTFIPNFGGGGGGGDVGPARREAELVASRILAARPDARAF